MNLSDLPSAVQRTYESVIPPVLEMLLVITATIYLVGFKNFAAQVKVIIEANNLLPTSSIQEVLRFYGLNTLIPIISLFIILALAHGVSKLVRRLGRLLPGFLIPNITLLMVTSVPEHVLLTLWSYFPPSSDINQINQSLEEDVHKARFRNDAALPLKGLVYRYDSIHRCSDRIDFIKGVVLWLVIVWLSCAYVIALPVPPTSRLVYALLLAGVLILFFAKRKMGAYREYSKAKVHAFLDLKALEFAERPTVAEDIPGTRSRVLEDLTKTAQKVGPWSFRFWIIERQPEYHWLLKAASSYFQNLYVAISRLVSTAGRHAKHLRRPWDAR